MKKVILQSLVYFLCMQQFLVALPKGASVELGEVRIEHQGDKMQIIHTSDKAVINYDQFSLHKGETVQFKQPSSSSCVLNRVKGGKESQILGTIESNGKVFLVNPEGIYFGKDSVVRVGSLIASTLNIANEDFFSERYEFILENKQSLSEIKNEGKICASPEGAIVLLAPVIRNLGQIEAKAGSLVLASGEHITLDFHGDGLLQFSVEGPIKGAVIEHLGSIQAEGGQVSFRSGVAKKAIRDVLNCEGVEKGEVFVMDGEDISLVPANHVLVRGKIDVSSPNDIGGSVSIVGYVVELQEADIRACGLHGGGVISLKGNNVDVDNLSSLMATSSLGKGGNVIALSGERTFFAGDVFASGLQGGFVETSSRGQLLIGEARVDTRGAETKSFGQWLLDPTTLTINQDGPDSPSGCSSTDSVIAASTIENVSSNTTVTLCANTIIQEVSITMENTGASLVFQAPPGADTGVIQFYADSIATQGGSVTIDNLNAEIYSSFHIDTGLGSSLGADITFGTINGTTGQESLLLSAGSAGVVTLGAVGQSSPLEDLTVFLAKEVSLEDITIRGSIDIVPTVRLAQSNTTIENLALTEVHFFALNAIEGTTAGEQSLTCITQGNTSLSIGNIGDSISLNSVFLEGERGISVGDVQAMSCTIRGGESEVTVRGDMLLPGMETVLVEGGDVLFVGQINAKQVDIEAVTEIVSLGVRQNFEVSEKLVLNVTNGSVGDPGNPIRVLVTGTIEIGSSDKALLQGSIAGGGSAITYVPHNEPCFVTFNDEVLVDCQAARRTTLFSLPKSTFIAFFQTPQRLGIGYSGLSFHNHRWYSQFGPLGDLRGFDHYHVRKGKGSEKEKKSIAVPQPSVTEQVLEGKWWFEV